jgi:hypothetical protein
MNYCGKYMKVYIQACVNLRNTKYFNHGKWDCFQGIRNI